MENAESRNRFISQKRGRSFLSYNEEASKERNRRTLEAPTIPTYVIDRVYTFGLPDFELTNPASNWLQW